MPIWLKTLICLWFIRTNLFCDKAYVVHILHDTTNLSQERLQLSVIRVILSVVIVIEQVSRFQYLSGEADLFILEKLMRLFIRKLSRPTYWKTNANLHSPKRQLTKASEPSFDLKGGAKGQI